MHRLHGSAAAHKSQCVLCSHAVWSVHVQKYYAHQVYCRDRGEDEGFKLHCQSLGLQLAVSTGTDCMA
jgi:hypothetical protein